eukprot:SAG31_NODE_552_length_14204_cov_14.295356_12_plen_65_part_00
MSKLIWIEPRDMELGDIEAACRRIRLPSLWIDTKFRGSYSPPTTSLAAVAAEIRGISVATRANG